MIESPSPLFSKAADRLSLLTGHGRGFLGMEHSSSPELAERVRLLFDRLDKKLGFVDSPEGNEARDAFNILVRAAYPEILLDLADLVYVQHERPAVVLNFDHININLRKDRAAQYGDRLNEKMTAAFNRLARVIQEDPELCNDREIVRLLSEGYSYYLYETKNFPWDNPMESFPQNPDRPVLDVATGLVGFSLIHEWPKEYPRLVLTDNMPFIVQGLTHYKNLAGKDNIDIREMDFSKEAPGEIACGCITVNKFLHHLQRPERQRFLRWALDTLEPGGSIRILDTDLEYQILKESKSSSFKGKLIPGYAETLVEIEGNFCHTLVEDTRTAGFEVTHFDFNEYRDETDAYSLQIGNNISIKFLGFEIVAAKNAV